MAATEMSRRTGRDVESSELSVGEPHDREEDGTPLSLSGSQDRQRMRRSMLFVTNPMRFCCTFLGEAQ